MSEDCHSSGQDMTPEDFERWKIEVQGEMMKAAKLLRSLSYGEGINSENLRQAVASLRGTKVAKPKSQHLGRWEELTLQDFQFLYACGVSCE